MLMLYVARSPELTFKLGTINIAVIESHSIPTALQVECENIVAYFVHCTLNAHIAIKITYLSQAYLDSNNMFSNRDKTYHQFHVSMLNLKMRQSLMILCHFMKQCNCICSNFLQRINLET